MMIATENKPATNFWDMGELAQSGLFLALFEGYTLEPSINQNDCRYKDTVGDIQRWFHLHEPRKIRRARPKVALDDVWCRDKGASPYPDHYYNPREMDYEKRRRPLI